MTGVNVTINMVPIVERPMMSPKDHPKSTVGNVSGGISPKTIHITHIFLFSRIACRVIKAIDATNVAMKTSVKVSAVAEAANTKTDRRRTVKPYVRFGLFRL